MLTTILLIAIAAVVSAAIVYLLVRSKAQAELLATSKEAELRTEQVRIEAKKESDALRSELQLLAAAKAKLEGEATTAEALTLQIAAKEEQLEALRVSLTETREALATAETRVTEVQKATDEAISAKEESTRLQLEEKERSLQAQLDEKQKSIDEQKALLAQAEAKLSETFDSLSVKALTTISEQFMQTAKATLETTQEQASGDLKLKQQAIEEMLKPIQESLAKVQAQHAELETKRTSAFDAIEKGLATISQEADQLANALRKPTARGAWGEMNLTTILTNAGLVEGVHFDLQDTTEDDEGSRLRPDVIIHLPNGRDFIIDSKAVIDNFWDGMTAQDEATKAEKFKAHAKLVRNHVKQLSSKGYWLRYKAAPDCVVMFIPTEGAYQAALEADPTLLTDAHASRIYIANPMTVVNMIHVTAYVLKEESLKQNAHEVQLAASELYDRLAKFAANFDDLGRNLRITVDKYNKAAGSFERRVLPQGRKVSSLGAGNGSELAEPRMLDAIPNALACAEARDHEPDEDAGSVQALPSMTKLA